MHTPVKRLARALTTGGGVPHVLELPMHAEGAGKAGVFITAGYESVCITEYGQTYQQHCGLPKTNLSPLNLGTSFGSGALDPTNTASRTSVSWPAITERYLANTRRGPCEAERKPGEQDCQRITAKMTNMTRVGTSALFNSPSGETPF